MLLLELRHVTQTHTLARDTHTRRIARDTDTSRMRSCTRTRCVYHPSLRTHHLALALAEAAAHRCLCAFAARALQHTRPGPSRCAVSCTLLRSGQRGRETASTRARPRGCGPAGPRDLRWRARGIGGHGSCERSKQLDRGQSASLSSQTRCFRRRFIPLDCALDSLHPLRDSFFFSFFSPSAFLDPSVDFFRAMSSSPPPFLLKDRTEEEEEEEAQVSQTWASSFSLVTSPSVGSLFRI